MSYAVKFENISKKFILHHERSKSFQEVVVSLLRRRNSANEDFWALKDVSFEVEQGETVGIIGPNGSGKSTILKLIARVLEPTEGDITVVGRVSSLIELGAGFHPDLTGRENVFLNGSILGLNRREMERKFGSIVSFAELEQFIDVPLKHYSSGMYTRLGFAVAINVDPDVLIIDEVLAVGDRSFQQKCLTAMGEFKKAGKTIILVSHAMPLVTSFCDRALLLLRGQVVALGPVSGVVNAYLGKNVQLDS